MKHQPDEGFWFPAKQHGLGWGLPVTWQGWVVLVVYLVVTTVGSAYLARSPTRQVDLPMFVIGTTSALIGICWLTGEKRNRDHSSR